MCAVGGLENALQFLAHEWPRRNSTTLPLWLQVRRLHAALLKLPLASCGRACRPCWCRRAQRVPCRRTWACCRCRCFSERNGGAQCWRKCTRTSRRATAWRMLGVHSIRDRWRQRLVADFPEWSAPSPFKWWASDNAKVHDETWRSAVAARAVALEVGPHPDTSSSFSLKTATNHLDLHIPTRKNY